MNRLKPIYYLLLIIVVASLAAACSSDCERDPTGIDQRSYNLGIIGGFSEVVKLGVKELALSEVLSPADMDAMMDDARDAAERNGVQLFREPDLLVTDLYPADVAVGKHVLLVYIGDTLDRYLAIKSDKAQLVASGTYVGIAREDIARRFGELLSYPDTVIDELIARQK